MDAATIYQISADDLFAFAEDVAIKAATQALRRFRTETESKYVTRQQAAEIANCTIRTIDNWMREGTIAYRKTGKKVLIERADLEGIRINNQK